MGHAERSVTADEHQINGSPETAETVSATAAANAAEKAMREAVVSAQCAAEEAVGSATDVMAKSQAGTTQPAAAMESTDGGAIGLGVLFALAGLR